MDLHAVVNNWWLHQEYCFLEYLASCATLAGAEQHFNAAGATFVELHSNDERSLSCRFMGAYKC